MSVNVKVLDKFDREVNIYKLIQKQAERAHMVMNSAEAGLDAHNIHCLVLAELLEESEKKQAKKQHLVSEVEEANSQPEEKGSEK